MHPGAWPGGVALVDQYSVRPGGEGASRDGGERVVLVPYGKDLGAGFERAKQLLARGDSVRLVGLGVTVRSGWPGWVGGAERFTLTELWAYRARSTIVATDELRTAIRRWLDHVFAGSPVGKRPAEALFGSACLRIFEPAILAHSDVLGIAERHGTSEIHVVGSDWVGTPVLRRHVQRRGGEVVEPASDRRASRLPWAVRMWPLGAACLVATALDQLRAYVRARRSRAELRRLRDRSRDGAAPDTWVVLIADWFRFSRTVVESVALPELDAKGRLGVLLAGSLAPGARNEANMRAHVGDELWPGLGALHDQLAACEVDQIVGPESVRELAGALARSAVASTKAIGRIVRGGDALVDGEVVVDLQPYARQLGVLATVDLARATQAFRATQRAVRRRDFEGKRVVFASSSAPELATADLVLQSAGAVTIELAHGSVGTGEPGARESRSQTLCVWSHADARVLEPLAQRCVVGGMPLPPTARERTRSESGKPRVLFVSNYVHVGYRVEGRQPLEPFLWELLRGASLVAGLGAGTVRWRPHPADDERAVASALARAPGVERSTNAELGRDLDWADVIVSSPSSSLFQALLRDVPVFLHLTPEYAETPAADFMAPERTFYFAEELVPKLASCLESLAADARAALRPERDARIRLFGPSGMPVPVSEALAGALGARP